MIESQALRKTWFERNWPWLILAGSAAAILSCVFCIAAGALGIFSVLKAHPAYRDGLEIVQSDPRAQELLGTPIESKWFVSGRVSESSGYGSAEISFPVSGPRGSGTVFVYAHREGGEWVVTRLVLVIDETGQRITLIGAG